MKNGRPQLKDVPAIAILRQQQAWWDNPVDRVWTIQAFPHWEPKLVLRKMEQLVHRGLLEYGVSLRTAWLTPAGKEAIEKEKYEDDN